jgi:hypothetical protein
MYVLLSTGRRLAGFIRHLNMSLSSHPVGQMYNHIYSRYATNADIYRSALTSHSGGGQIVNTGSIEWPCGDIGGIYGTMTSSSLLHSRTGNQVELATSVDGAQHYEPSRVVDSLSRPTPEVQILFDQQHYGGDSLLTKRPSSTTAAKNGGVAESQLKLFSGGESGYPVCSSVPVDPSLVGLHQLTPHQDGRSMAPSLDCIDRDAVPMAASAAPETVQLFGGGVVADETMRSCKSRSSSSASKAGSDDSETESKADLEIGGHVLAPHHGDGGDATSERHCLLWACKTCKKKTTAAVDRRKVSPPTLCAIYSHGFSMQ